MSMLRISLNAKSVRKKKVKKCPQQVWIAKVASMRKKEITVRATMSMLSKRNALSSPSFQSKYLRSFLPSTA